MTEYPLNHLRTGIGFPIVAVASCADPTLLGDDLDHAVATGVRSGIPLGDALLVLIAPQPEPRLPVRELLPVGPVVVPELPDGRGERQPSLGGVSFAFSIGL